MDAIKQFNAILNKSTLNRFEDWKEYRNQLTEYITKNIADNTGSILILGCGNADDLDLSVLARKCQTMMLSDIDDQALKNAIKKYKMNSKQVSIKAHDYTGLNSNRNWNNFVNEMIKIDNPEDISSFFNEIETTINGHNFSEFETTYDVIIISPIYTQLLFQQGLSYIQILDS